MKTCNRCEATKPIEAFAKNGKCGRHPVCKVCRAEIERQRRAADPERARVLEKNRYKANPEAKKLACSKYYADNKDRIIAREHLRYQLKSEQIKEQKKDYREQNKPRIRFHNGTRRALLRSALVKWADRAIISSIYKEASQLWGETGIPHHVDHVIPLKHDLVCGLHVPENLQILTGSENIRKGNRFAIDD